MSILPPVPGHDTLRDAEAQARARDPERLRVGAAEELREQSRLVLLRDAEPVVRALEHDPVAAASHGDRHLPARGGELHRVAHEVLHDALEVTRTAPHGRQPVLQVEGQTDPLGVGARSEHVDDVARHLAEVDVGLGHGPVGVTDPRQA